MSTVSGIEEDEQGIAKGIPVADCRMYNHMGISDYLRIVDNVGIASIAGIPDTFYTFHAAAAEHNTHFQLGAQAELGLSA